MKAILFFALLLPLPLMAQVDEDFTDGDFMNDPEWTGDTAYWQVEGGKLQSRFSGKKTAGRLFFYLSTASTSVTGTSWEFWVQIHFNTSSRNYVDVYLVSDQEEPRCGPGRCKGTHGYFVRIGGTPDQVSLYRKDSLEDHLLINGRAGITDHSNNILKIKVTCDYKHQWSLYDDSNGSGDIYFREGAVTDSTYLQSKFFSILVNQNGKSDSGKHYFDDINIKPFFPDTLKPLLHEIFPVDAHHINLLFSEPLTPPSAENLLYYSADGGLIMPDSALLDEHDPRLVHLYFEKPFEQAKKYHLHFKYVSDLSGNEADSAVSFIYYTPRQYDVVIDELFPDPTPSQGLPIYEFAEIKNRTPYPVNLSGWKFCDLTRCSVLPSYMLPPDSLLIICNKTNDTAFTRYGKTIGLSHFPSLNNAGDELMLYNRTGNVVHSTAYTRDWYQDSVKDDGGWTLEMKDTRFPCIGDSNWTASMAPSGGTPGKINSVNNHSGEISSLALEYVSVLDSENIVAHFNIGLDSLSASQPGHYSLNDESIQSAAAEGPLFNAVHLHLSAPLQKRKIYTLHVNDLGACGNIQTGLDNTARFGLPEPVDSLDIVINEILFNPRGGSKDFVELYNHSPKIIDAGTLQLANQNAYRQVTSVKNIADIPCYLFPHGYLALTGDKQDLQQQYFCKAPAAVWQMKSLPQYPNMDGTVVLLDTAGHIIDEVAYNANEQSALLHDDEGVSLERVDDKGKSNDPANWRSASSTAGYATPGYLNSQAATADTLGHAFTVVPKIFSPDGDGMDDFANITYRLPQGYTGKIIIFDANGHLVRHLVKNALLGTHGKIRWDGKNDRMQIMPTGIYVVYIQIFNLQGKVRRYKLPLVLVKKHQ